MPSHSGSCNLGGNRGLKGLHPRVVALQYRRIDTKTRVKHLLCVPLGVSHSCTRKVLFQTSIIDTYGVCIKVADWIEESITINSASPSTGGID